MFHKIIYAKSTSLKGYSSPIISGALISHNTKKVSNALHLKLEWEWSISSATTKMHFPFNNFSSITQYTNPQKLIHLPWFLLTLVAKNQEDSYFNKHASHSGRLQTTKGLFPHTQPQLLLVKAEGHYVKKPKNWKQVAILYSCHPTVFLVQT